MALSAAAAPSPCTRARLRAIATERSVVAAYLAASSVQDLANSMDLRIVSASRLPAAARLVTMEAVMLSIPWEAGPRRPRGRGLNPGEVRVDALDGLVRLVHLDGDDQFDLVIAGHVDSPRGVRSRSSASDSWSRRHIA